MQFTTQHLGDTTLGNLETPCLILPIWQDAKLFEPASFLDSALGGMIEATIKEDGFDAKRGATKVLFTAGKLKIARIILVGLGKRAEFSKYTYTLAMARAAQTARKIKRGALTVAAPLHGGISIPEKVLASAAVQGILLGLYTFTDFLSQDALPFEVESVALRCNAADDVIAGIAEGQVIAGAVIRTRRFVNLPSNHMFPQALAEEAENIAKEHGLICEIWDENRLQKERMGAFWNVGRGSDKPPRLIRLEHCPAGYENEKPIVLVGKGVTFDTGGYSIKTATGMDTMKDDMGGASVVISVLEAAAKAQLQRRIIGLVGSVENEISGHAQHPGDVVRARNGKTIEVLNTDAEGRLVLSDVLCYASELNPAAIIDLATLTGAVGIALGREAAGLFSNDDNLAKVLFEAGQQTGEKVWRLPMWEEYDAHMKGKDTDLKNISGDRYAGAINAAVFLKNFVGENIPWAHLDIGTVAYAREDRGLSQYGATGYGTRLIWEAINQL